MACGAVEARSARFSTLSSPIVSACLTSWLLNCSFACRLAASSPTRGAMIGVSVA
jgi:hypothetical protein